MKIENQLATTHDNNAAEIALKLIPIIPVIDTEDLVLQCMLIVSQPHSR